jgi:ribonuclease-3
VAKLDRARLKHLKLFQKAVKYRFRDKELLNAALTHKSYAFEQPPRHMPEWNERLEFFGDSVLGLVVSEYLYKKFKNIQEGDLSKFKAHVVCTDSLIKNAVRLHVGDFLLLGRGEERTNGRSQPSNLSCALEAVIGAVYLDRDTKAAEKFILNVFKEELHELTRKDRQTKDYKSLLQEQSLKKFGMIPHYELISQDGPEHKKEFVVGVRIAGQAYGRGWGLNKKNAEQLAAKETLDKIR